MPRAHAHEARRIRLPSASRYFASRFRAAGTAKRAVGEKAYHKSALRFHGVGAADVTLACREFLRDREALSRQELRATDLPWLIGLVRRSPGWAHVDQGRSQGFPKMK